jgi:caa(3)-type oxidase subunit IV
MDQNVMLAVLWAASGAVMGGVLTPVLASNTRLNDWVAALVGVAAGLIGNIFLLVPLWVIIWRFVPSLSDERLAWQRDTASLDEMKLSLANATPPLAELRRHFWPETRAEHSHRLTYVGVFLALVIITAIEVTISYLDLPFSPVAPLVTLSTIKVMLVVMFFMHLRYDSKWYSAIFLASVPFAVMILSVLAAAAAAE